MFDELTIFELTIFAIDDLVCRVEAPGKTGRVCELCHQSGSIRVQWHDTRTWNKPDALVKVRELSIPPDKILPCRIYQVVSAPDKSRISIGDFIRLDHQGFLEVVSGQPPGREFFLPDEADELIDNLKLELLEGEWETLIRNQHFC